MEQRVAFKMKLHKGHEAEYKRRHEELWPGLQDLLRSSGVSEYSIFLDEATNDLFGILKAADMQLFNSLSQHPLMQQWWAYMKDIMDTNEDNSPATIPLTEIFYLP